MRDISPFREWLGVVMHPLRYMAYCRLRRDILNALRDAPRPTPATPCRTYTYVGPAIEHEGGLAIDTRNLPRC